MATGRHRSGIHWLMAGLLALGLGLSELSGPSGAMAASPDPDRDGLTSEFERDRSRTDPRDADSDDDGTPDGREDHDDDRLVNLWEMRLGLHPRRQDTDRDGTDDGREDRDRDRLRNAFEIRSSRTDPRATDSDQDGIRDSAEDPDGDRLSNAGEQRYGTDPHVADTDGDAVTDWREDSDEDGTADGLTQDQRPVPSSIQALLADPKDRPASHGACQQKDGRSKVLVCRRGARGRKVVLFGDSHALQWRGPLERVAKVRGWRLWFITKSACPVARISRPRPDCGIWRKRAFKVIADIRPDLVIVANLDGYDSQRARTEAHNARLWRRGLTSTLRTLDRSARKVVLLGDTSRWDDPPTCLAAHPDDMSACGVRRSTAIKPDRIANDRAAAAAAGVSYRRTVDLTCPYDPCPAIIDRILLSYDGGHMTYRFARTLWRGLAALLPNP